MLHFYLEFHGYNVTKYKKHNPNEYTSLLNGLCFNLVVSAFNNSGAKYDYVPTTFIVYI